jgi:hypothetical protein
MPDVCLVTTGVGNDTNRYQASVVGCGHSRHRNPGVPRMVAKRRSFPICRQRAGQSRATVNAGKRRGRCTTNHTPRGGGRGGCRRSRCRYPLRSRARERNLRLPLNSSVARKLIPERALRARARLLRLCATVAIPVAFVVGDTRGASALPVTPFRYEAQAQRHCPVDVVVWLDFRKKIYYSKRQRQYARGYTGSFVCREEARSSGYRHALLGLR